MYICIVSAVSLNDNIISLSGVHKCADLCTHCTHTIYTVNNGLSDEYDSQILFDVSIIL